MTEGEHHKQLVARIKTVLGTENWEKLENDWSRGWGGWQFPEMKTDKGPKQWTIDAYFKKMGLRLACEVDRYKGPHSHGTKHAQADDDFRDRYLELHFGIITVRFNVLHFIGKKALSDAYILAEIYSKLWLKGIVTQAVWWSYKNRAIATPYLEVDRK